MEAMSDCLSNVTKFLTDPVERKNYLIFVWSSWGGEVVLCC